MPQVSVSKLAVPKTLSEIQYRYCILVGVICGAVLYILWLENIEPIHGSLNWLIVPIQGGISIAAISLQQIPVTLAEQFSNNPLPFIVGALSAIGAVYGIIGKIRAEHAKTTAITEANQQIGEYQKQMIEFGQDVNTKFAQKDSQIAQLSQKLQVYETDPFYGEAQTRIDELKVELERANAEKVALSGLLADWKKKESVIVK